MNKKTFFAVLSAAVLVSASYIGYRQVSNSPADDLFTANVEALSSMESSKLDCSYVRETEDCTIDVGVHGKIQILGGAILTAGGDGKITIDGVVVCSRGGDSACTPIECADLYETIFD